MQHIKVGVEGHLDEHWSDWLGGLTIAYTEKNETVLTGSLADQAALYGLIGKLQDLGVTIVSVDYRGQPSKENV